MGKTQEGITEREIRIFPKMKRIMTVRIKREGINISLCQAKCKREKVNNLAGPENEGKSLEGRQKNTYTHRKRRKGERKKTLLDDPVLTQMA